MFHSHDVEVSGIQAIGTTSGVRFKSSGQRGGVVSNIHIHDVQMTNVANPFEFNLDWYRAYSVPTLPPILVSCLRIAKRKSCGTPVFW